MERPGYSEKRDARWWLSNFESIRHEKLFSVVERIDNQQIYRRDALLRWMQLYRGYPVLSLGQRARSQPRAGQRLSSNIIQVCCDAFAAKVTKDQPKVTVATHGAEWELQQKAKELDKFLDAETHDMGFYPKSRAMVLDAAITGTGVLKILIEGTGEHAQVSCDHVLPFELKIDDQEGLYGCPANWYQVKYYDRLKLIEMFPEKRDAIERSKSTHDDIIAVGYDSTADQVKVIEGWHLPSGPGAEDGWHTIALEDVTLEDGPWKYRYAPFLVFRAWKASEGFWGIGIAERLEGIQYEINVLNSHIQRSYHLMAAAHWMVDNATKINSHGIDNDIGSIIRYTGQAPTPIVPQPVHPDIYERERRLWERAFEQIGLNMTDSRADRPAGVDSAVAMRTYASLGTERQAIPVRDYQNVFLDLAEQIIDRAREIAKVYPNFEVKARSKSVMSHVRFLDVDLEENDRVLRLYPTNALQEEPVSKTQQVSEWVKAGWLEPNEAKRLLDFPDIEAVQSEENASFDLVKEIIAKFLDPKDGDYIGPEPFLDLKQGIRMMQRSYVRAKANKVPEERLQLFRDWIEDADAILHPPPPPGAENVGAPGAPPPAGPEGAPPPDMPPAGPGGPPGGVPVPMPPPGPAPMGPPPNPLPEAA